ncbi:adenine nucleotide alpha hydrolases-like protein [Bimuria novae-zelandiae CBS 107.79]|uniref:Adenine nucleotide alpha hydrolases-like protein n=1 Tax=Bimuria novae-zelandiae CBS 107.79 TaxID=1447943 RepID=A0A6A5VLF0_9PLEO|nr:adenine nucleotide alpha hydrolases-like protein [Bimuria novae-zelandiae CBS 107.79]
MAEYALPLAGSSRTEHCVFQPRVSFDTFDKPADFIEENSFTLIAKHKDYEYTKRSRTFLCGCDDNDYSEYALQWLIDELVDDGDEVVCLRVVEKDDTIASDRSVEKGRYRAEAEALMKTVQAKNHENKAINLILEFAMGKVNTVIDDMINLYEPAILVVGTRGRSLGGFQGLLPGSVSKYCLQHSPVPVIVVRPSSKRDKARNKRALDPTRQAYKDLLEKSGNLIDTDARNVYSESSRSHSRQPSEDEAAAVAAAIGYKPLEGSPLAQTRTVPSRLDTTISDSDLKSPGIVMKSPELQNLESPEISDSSSSSEDEDEGGIPTDAPTAPIASLGVEGDAEQRGSQKAKEEPSESVADIKEPETSTAEPVLNEPSTQMEAEPKDEVALQAIESPKAASTT